MLFERENHMADASIIFKVAHTAVVVAVVSGAWRCWQTRNIIWGMYNPNPVLPLDQTHPKIIDQ